MKSKKWIKIFFFISSTLLIFLILINFVVDPFNIFNSKFLKYHFQINERFIKIEYLEKNHKHFNGYMFGSSRIGTTNPKVVEKSLSNIDIYNFTISSANLYDYLLYLKYFLKRGYPVDVLYLQLDLNDMNKYGQNNSDYLRKAHPYIYDESLFSYYKSYLLGYFPDNIEGKIKRNINSESPVEYSLETGVWSKPKNEKLVSEDCKSYQKSISSFNKKRKRNISYTKSKQNVKALKEIVELSNTNNIKLYVFITPHNQNMMDMFKIDDYLKYIKEISEITPFYNFSGYNSVTLDNCNYYEYSHYRPHVSELISARIFNDKNVPVPPDFGTYVTSDNISTHLNNLKKQIEKHDFVRFLEENN